MNNNEWEKVGIIGVDAGLCWIGDPCYIISDHCEEFDNRDWHGFLEILRKNNATAKDEGNPDTAQFNCKLGHAGLGVCVDTGFGDGTYDVFIKRESSEGRVAEVKVVFIGENEVDEDEE